MTNPEVLAVDQDVLGKGAARIYQRERLELWARPLADGIDRRRALQPRPADGDVDRDMGGAGAGRESAGAGSLAAQGARLVRARVFDPRPRPRRRHGQDQQVRVRGVREVLMKRAVLGVILLCGVALSAQQAGQQQGQRPPGGIPNGPAIVQSFASAMITAPPPELGLDPFYKKYTDAFGIPVVSSEKVDDNALLMARDIVNYMLLKRPDVRAVMIQKKSRLLVMARVEGEMDLPERRDWKKPAIDDRRLTPGERAGYNSATGIANMTDAQYWNQRARGMGGNITSCAEENLLGLPGTRYYGEHITVHEFSHNIMSALRTADPDLVKEVDAAYEAAKAKGLYKDQAGREQYAINTVAEYSGRGHAMVVLVEHRVLRRHHRRTRADAGRVQGVRPDALRDSRSRVRRPPHPGGCVLREESQAGDSAIGLLRPEA